jgi:hypothetical protein
MKKNLFILFVLVLAFALVLPQSVQAADPFANVSSVNMNAGIMTITGTAPIGAKVYTLVSVGKNINVYVYRRGGCSECGYGIPYTKTVNLNRYITSTRGNQKILVNREQYYP